MQDTHDLKGIKSKFEELQIELHGTVQQFSNKFCSANELKIKTARARQFVITSHFPVDSS